MLKCKKTIRKIQAEWKKLQYIFIKNWFHFRIYLKQFPHSSLFVLMNCALHSNECQFSSRKIFFVHFLQLSVNLNLFYFRQLIRISSRWRSGRKTTISSRMYTTCATRRWLSGWRTLRRLDLELDHVPDFLQAGIVIFNTLKLFKNF